MRSLVVAGIGTGVGKTFVAAVLAQALKADYWKPVQAGSLDDTDTDFVRVHTSAAGKFHREAYRLTEPMSPHAAAEIDGITIAVDQLTIPVTGNKLIIEQAGGLMVPLNNTSLNIDLLQHWQAPVVLVSQHYLGSINHTLLSAAALKQYRIPVLGILFNGPPNPASESIILRHTGMKCIARFGQQPEISKAVIAQLASDLGPALNDLL